VTRTFPLLGLLPLVLACGEKEDDTGGEYWMPYCEETRTALGFDELSPLGFSAAEAAVALGSLHSGGFFWARGGETTFESELALTSSVFFVDLEEATPPDDATVPSIAVVCDDYLEVAVTLGLATGDGLLDEHWALTMSLLQVDEGDLYADLALSDFSDPSIFDAFQVDEATEQHPTLKARFGPEGAAYGDLAWSSEGEGEGTAWAGTDPVASWGSGAE